MKLISLTAGFAALLASLALAFIFYRYVPIGGDGTWYSYPAYAQLHASDPSENIPGIARQRPPPDRLVSTFGWENRSNLTVALTRGWLELVPPSWQSIKWFGIVQLLALLMLFAVLVWHLTQNAVLTSLATCVLATDSRVIAESFADARPDVTIALAATAFLLLLLLALKSRRNGLLLVPAALLAVALPILHVTSAFAVAYVVAALALYAFLSRHDADFRIIAWGAAMFGAITIGSFVLRQDLLDVFVPTQVSLQMEDTYRHHLADQLRFIVADGFLAKVNMELGRWASYYFLANAAQFLFTAAGLVGTVVLLKRMTSPPAAQDRGALALTGGFLAAAAAVALTDSHDLVQHALVLAVLEYAAAAAVLGALLRFAVISAGQVRVLSVAVLSLAAILNAAHCVKLYRAYGGFHYSNQQLENTLLTTLPPTGDIVAVGPTEIWPYVVERRQPFWLVDFDRSVFAHNGGKFDPDAMPGYKDARFLIVNKEYYVNYRWGEAIAEWRRRGLLRMLTELGDCERAGDCLQIYEFTRPAVPS